MKRGSKSGPQSLGRNQLLSEKDVALTRQTLKTRSPKSPKGSIKFWKNTKISQFSCFFSLFYQGSELFVSFSTYFSIWLWRVGIDISSQKLSQNHTQIVKISRLNHVSTQSWKPDLALGTHRKLQTKSEKYTFCNF